MTAFMVEKTDRLAMEKGAIYISDMTDTAILNIDLQISKFKVNLVNQHYPLLYQKMYFVNVPLLVKPLIKLIISFMKASIKEAVENCDYEQLAELVDKDVLHEEMMGTRKERYYCKEARELSLIADKVGVSQDVVRQFYKYYEQNKTINNNL